MDQRQDAMLAAARFTVAVNEAVTREPGRQVATVGRLNVSPNTTNVIPGQVTLTVDRKSTRLNSSHANISYAVFCLKKKKALHRCPRRRTPTLHGRGDLQQDLHREDQAERR